MKESVDNRDVPPVSQSGPRRVARRLGRAWAPALLLLASACGGGGGGDGSASGTPGTTPSPATPPATTPSPGTPSSATLSIGGTATYDFVPNTNGALSYGATVARPIRGATVEIVGADGTVLASTRTDAAGAYAATVAAQGTVSVRVKAQMLQATGASTWDVSVRDNTQGDGIYALETPTFQVGTEAVVRNVAASSGWTGSGYGATRAAAPFAILDTIYTAQAKVTAVAPSLAFPPLRVFWSPSNRSVAGNVALGEIGSTAFVSNASGLAIYVVGRENVDTDEYDASVVAHEWGHYYQAAFSRDDSIGGSHSAADRLDRRVAFSEGWGNAWSGIALERGDYTDSVGLSQAQGARIDLSRGASSNPGWFREDSIQSILWNLNRQVGFKALHDAFTGSFRRGAAVTSIHPFAAAFSAATPAAAPVLSGLLAGQNISAAPGDPFGVAETNNGGVAEALPMYRSAAVGGSVQACVGYQAGAPNRLGNYVYLRFAAPTARTYAITVSGAASSDPDLTIWGAGVGFVTAASAGGSIERASAVLPAGDAVIALRDYNLSIASPCFTVTIQ